MINLGLDFDNTLIDYDEVFYEIASEKNLIPKNDHLKIYGPVSAPISKIKSNFRSRILIKYSTKIRPQKLLKETVEKMKNFKNIKVEIDVDPINFM